VATCPSGHQSVSDDFCDVCGVLIAAAPSLPLEPAPGCVYPVPGPGPGTGGMTVGGVPLASAEPCPRCGVARAGQFCESCGYDFTAVGQDTFGPSASGPGADPSAPPPPVPQSWGPLPAPPATGPATATPPSAPVHSAAVADAEWTAVVSADRAYYDSIQAAGGPDAAAIGFPAYCPQRLFKLTGAEMRIGRHSTSSGIDPEIDLSVPPADPGISRLHAVLLKAPDGTWSVIDPGSANGTVVNGTEIPSGQAVPLHDGDRIHLGAWTALRLVRGS
jgi:hypothetical protein